MISFNSAYLIHSYEPVHSEVLMSVVTCSSLVQTAGLQTLGSNQWWSMQRFRDGINWTSRWVTTPMTTSIGEGWLEWGVVTTPFISHRWLEWSMITSALANSCDSSALIMYCSMQIRWVRSYGDGSHRIAAWLLVNNMASNGLSLVLSPKAGEKTVLNRIRCIKSPMHDS